MDSDRKLKEIERNRKLAGKEHCDLEAFMERKGFTDENRPSDLKVQQLLDYERRDWMMRITYVSVGFLVILAFFVPYPLWLSGLVMLSIFFPGRRVD